MNRLFYGVLIALITAVIVFFAPAANADASQVTLPGSAPPSGAPQQKNAVHYNVNDSGVHYYNPGSVGPNTVPNNVNSNGTVYTTPGILNGTDNSK
jgi:biopolymer transport protein ExbD